MRNYAKQTNIRLIIGALVLLVIVGSVLILLIYGKQAVFSSLLCIISGLLPIILISIILWVIDRIAKKYDK